MPESFGVGEFECLYEVVQGDGFWVATLTKLQTKSGEGVGLLDIKETGTSAKDAAEKLTTKVRNNFTFQVQSLSPLQAGLASFKWIKDGTSAKQRLARVLTILLILVIASPLFFDFFSGTSPLSRNVSGAISALKPKGIEPKGYFDEQFFEQALKTANKRFYASGVSFRNLVSGNRAGLIETLGRISDFKLILLDPETPLASDTYIRKFSRTATKADINSTISKFLNENDGILSKFGNKNRHQLWTSDYAPIVPMVVVDDTVYVSFLVHVDSSATSNLYRASYLVFDTNSDIGKMLLKHFEDLLDAQGSHRLFPTS